MTVAVKKYWLPWAGFSVALLMHLWRLGLPAEFISDEYYFVQDGRNYLTQTMYVDAHPPLAKLQSAVVFTFFGYSPLTWRVVNAVEGALLVPLIWWLAMLVIKDRRAAALAMFFALVDGFLLVESRSGLINIPYVVYSFLALALVLKALQRPLSFRLVALAGTFIGLAISVKWLAALITIPATILWFRPEWFGQPNPERASRWWVLQSILWLILWPLLLYLGVFWLHFAWLGVLTDTWRTNLLMIYHHTHGKTGHLYRQPWFGWLALWQPFLYSVRELNGKISTIWSLPNPFVWWTGAAALFFSLWRRWAAAPHRLLNIFLLANWLPFAFIRRDMFSYHAMPFGVFLILLLAAFGATLWSRGRRWIIAHAVAATLAFAWFLPWYLNLPLSPAQYRWRQWLPNWRIKSPPPRAIGIGAATSRFASPTVFPNQPAQRPPTDASSGG